MSRGRESEAHAAHLTEEDLLELALDAEAGRVSLEGSATDTLRGALACATCAQALERARAEVRALRLAALDLEPSAQGAAHAVERTLGATTREDLSWRGDWRVVGRYLGDRLRSSRAVRLLAASLLVHLLTLPVIAWVLLRHAADDTGVVLTIELPSQVEPAPTPPGPPALEPRRELVRDPMPETPGPSSYAVELPARGAALQTARRELLAAGVPPVAAGTERNALPADTTTTGAVARLLDARSRRLSLGALDESVETPGARAPLCVRALWAELLLDDWAISGRADPRLAGALQTLRDEHAAATGTSGTADRELARRALARAAAQGAVFAGENLAGDSGTALSRGWFEALEGSLGERAAQDPSGTISAWISWGRRHAR